MAGATQTNKRDTTDESKRTTKRLRRITLEKQKNAERGDNSDSEATYSSPASDREEETSSEENDATAPEGRPPQPQPTVKSVHEVVALGQRARMNCIRYGSWNLYSPLFMGLLTRPHAPHGNRTPRLQFNKVPSPPNSEGTDRESYVCIILIGSIKIVTYPIEVPGYPSVAPQALYGRVDGWRLYPIKMAFFGTGCVKVCLPRMLVERGVGRESSECAEAEKIELTGVHVEDADD